MNEEKRTTEGMIHLFDLVNDIKDCPPDLLSSTRKLICQVDAKLIILDENNELIALKNRPITLFLFTDKIEVTIMKKIIK